MQIIRQLLPLILCSALSSLVSPTAGTGGSGVDVYDVNNPFVQIRKDYPSKCFHQALPHITYALLAGIAALAIHKTESIWKLDTDKPLTIFPYLAGLASETLLIPATAALTFSALHKLKTPWITVIAALACGTAAFSLKKNIQKLERLQNEWDMLRKKEVDDLCEENENSSDGALRYQELLDTFTKKHPRPTDDMQLFRLKITLFICTLAPWIMTLESICQGIINQRQYEVWKQLEGPANDLRKSIKAILDSADRGGDENLNAHLGTIAINPNGKDSALRYLFSLTYHTQQTHISSLSDAAETFDKTIEEAIENNKNYHSLLTPVIPKKLAIDTNKLTGMIPETGDSSQRRSQPGMTNFLMVPESDPARARSFFDQFNQYLNEHKEYYPFYQLTEDNFDHICRSLVPAEPDQNGGQLVDYTNARLT